MQWFPSEMKTKVGNDWGQAKKLKIKAGYL